jgi:hypothetical protein
MNFPIWSLHFVFDENHPVVLYQYSVYYEFRREHNNVRND